MENAQKKNSDAKIRANAKYTKNHYKNISIKIKPEEAETIRSAASLYNMSIAQYIIRASNYITENNIELD